MTASARVSTDQGDLWSEQPVPVTHVTLDRKLQPPLTRHRLILNPQPIPFQKVLSEAFLKHVSSPSHELLLTDTTHPRASKNQADLPIVRHFGFVLQSQDKRRTARPLRRTKSTRVIKHMPGVGVQRVVEEVDRHLIYLQRRS